MPSWDTIFNSVQTMNAIEEQKRIYFEKLTQHTKRNCIVYFSSWQQNPGIIDQSFNIDDDDRNGFMNALFGIDKTQGLDLIIHTPGGDLAATQSIVDYLFTFFGGDIRVIVPLTAMSAGTMIACSAKEIIMGKQSNLGPIDPQIGGMPANEFIDLLTRAMNDLQNNANTNYWHMTLSKYPPTFFGLCKNAIDASNKVVGQWLKRSMLKSAAEADIKETVTYLSNYHYHLQHNTRLTATILLENTKLNIKALEDDQDLQEAVLSLYHCYQIMASSSNVAKIIENQKLVKFIKKRSV